MSAPADTDQPTLAVIQADREAAAEWSFIECRRCSEYEGDFTEDLAAAFARHRTNSEPRPAGDLREALPDDVRADFICVRDAVTDEQWEKLWVSLHGLKCNPVMDEITLVMQEVVAILCGPKIATHSPAPMADSPYVAGPIWAEAEDDCFTAEVQIVGGHAVVATVHGGTRDEAEQRQSAVIRALAAHPSTQEG